MAVASEANAEHVARLERREIEGILRIGRTRPPNEVDDRRVAGPARVQTDMSVAVAKMMRPLLDLTILHLRPARGSGQVEELAGVRNTGEAEQGDEEKDGCGKELSQFG